jgi:multisubunit Na+/H+ antiporter MnhF subunit
MIALAADISRGADPAGLDRWLSLGDWLTALVTEVSIVVAVAGILLCVLRMLRGPHLADRALAADTIAVHLVALIALLTIRYDTLAFFDGALIVSLLGFATTVAMGQFIIRRRLRQAGVHEQPASPAAGEETAP